MDVRVYPKDRSGQIRISTAKERKDAQKLVLLEEGEVEKIEIV